MKRIKSAASRCWLQIRLAWMLSGLPGTLDFWKE